MFSFLIYRDLQKKMYQNQASEIEKKQENACNREKLDQVPENLLQPLQTVS